MADVDLADQEPPEWLMVHPSDELYGADKVFVRVAALAARHGSVVTWLPDDVEYPERLLTQELRAEGIAVSRVPYPVLRRQYMRPGALPGLVRRGVQGSLRLLAMRPQRVYLSTSATLPLAPLARLTGAQVLVHVHEIWGPTERLVLGPFIRAATHVVAVSTMTKARLPRRVHDRVRVIPNGFAINGAEDAERARVRRTVGFGESEVVVVIASRWNSWKGHEAFLRAWAGIDRQDLRLVILGGPPPAGQAVDVVAMVASLPNRDSVTIVGETTTPLDWIAAADVVVVPSTKPDPLPTIAIEAGGMGRAVLASDDGGLPEIVVDGVTGMLLPPGDVDAWTSALDGLDSTLLARWGAAARERYVQMFDVGVFDRRTLELLSAVRPRASLALRTRSAGRRGR